MEMFFFLLASNAELYIFSVTCISLNKNDLNKQSIAGDLRCNDAHVALP